MRGRKHTEETRKKCGRQGEDHAWYGRKHTEESKKKIGAASKGRYFSPESREKMSEKASGENNPFYGKTHSQETKKKLKDAFKGRKHDEKARIKRREAGLKLWGNDEYRKSLSSSIKQIDFETGQVINVFDSVSDASRITGISINSIRNTAAKRQQQAGGFQWEYVAKVERGKRVNQLDLETGEIIQTYDTITAAAKATPANRTAIIRVLNGGRFSSGGFGWEYAGKQNDE